MLGGQAQEATGGSVALQAARDATFHYHGPSFGDVRELVELVFQNQLPVMREEARKVFEANAAKFREEFVRQLASSSKVSAQEFAKPDTQATFQQALTGTALKGDDADLELVAAALVRRLEAAEEPLLKQVLESAIAVMPKLVRPQIAFLAFVHYAKRVRHISATQLAQVELMAAQVMPVLESGLSLSAPNQQYLAGLGLLTLNPVASASLWLHDLHQTHSFLPPDMDQLRAAGCVHLCRLLEAYDTLQVPQAFPTLTGSAVGLLQLQRALGKIDLSIWIR